jgi:hypothetical protein
MENISSKEDIMRSLGNPQIIDLNGIIPVNR